MNPALCLRFMNSAGKNLILTLVSMCPVVELRGAVPLGAVLKVKWYQTFLSTAAGNFLPIPFVLRRGDRVLERARGCRPVDKFLSRLRAYMEGKSAAFRKNMALTLVLIIAVPFTGVGAWGASLIANMLGLDKKNSLRAIVAGILISGMLTTLATYGVVCTFRFLF